MQDQNKLGKQLKSRAEASIRRIVDKVKWSKTIVIPLQYVFSGDQGGEGKDGGEGGW